MKAADNIKERENEKKKRKFCCRPTSFYHYLMLLFSTVGLFIFGQYQLAGKLVFSHTFAHSHEVAQKHRRALNNTIKVIKPKLSFPKEYYVKGILKLPYGDIVEPFEAWYSGDQKMSRIDYYGGMDKTYQREDIGEFGFAAKVVPEYSEKTDKIFKGCLHHVGTKRYPIKAQSVVPSPKLFKFKEKCILNKTIPCWKWEHTFLILTKVNTYTLYTTRSLPTKPLRYEMMGYDTLLTSYYDKYILQYDKFHPLSFDFDTFEIPTDLHCFDFKSDEASESSVSSYNPMLEFISHQNERPQKDTVPSNKTKSKKITEEELEKDSANENLVKNHFELVVETIFREYKNSFNKNYADDLEHVKRKDIFRHNLRFINTLNRQHLTYKLQVNHFADATDKEMNRYKGLLNESYQDETALKFEPPKIDLAITPIPSSLDWREYGAVTDVRSQGICGSCYAYAVTGAIEGAYYLKTGVLNDLSEQQIVDCSWGFGNKGCKGGYPYRAMQWILKHGGIATQTSYGNYLAQEGYCHFSNITNGATITGYYNITSGNATEMKMALSLYGPLTVLINTRPRSFKFYDSGIYYDKNCDTKLDHAALAVGYGEENGEEYWVIKNSWSFSWGDKGFIKISARDDNCGVTQKAVVVKVKSDSDLQ